MGVVVGQSLPVAELTLKGKVFPLSARFSDQPGVLIGVPGAFTPEASERLIPAWRSVSRYFKSYGLGFLGCLSVNDHFVLKGWAKKMRVRDEIVFVSDPNAILTKALDLLCDHHTQSIYGGDSTRCRYFGILVAKGGKVLDLVLDDQLFTSKLFKSVADYLGVSLPSDILASMHPPHTYIHTHAHTHLRTHTHTHSSYT